jgi:hypothetical protein
MSLSFAQHYKSFTPINSSPSQLIGLGRDIWYVYWGDRLTGDAKKDNPEDLGRWGIGKINIDPAGQLSAQQQWWLPKIPSEGIPSHAKPPHFEIDNMINGEFVIKIKVIYKADSGGWNPEVTHLFSFSLLNGTSKVGVLNPDCYVENGKLLAIPNTTPYHLDDWEYAPETKKAQDQHWMQRKMLWHRHHTINDPEWFKPVPEYGEPQVRRDYSSEEPNLIFVPCVEKRKLLLVDWRQTLEKTDDAFAQARSQNKIAQFRFDDGLIFETDDHQFDLIVQAVNMNVEAASWVRSLFSLRIGSLDELRELSEGVHECTPGWTYCDIYCKSPEVDVT